MFTYSLWCAVQVFCNSCSNSVLFSHVHNIKPFKSDGLFCKLYFCGCSGSILPVVQFGIYKIKGKHRIYLGPVKLSRNVHVTLDKDLLLFFLELHQQVALYLIGNSHV